MDEHPDSINSPGFWPPNNAVTFPDAPATFHNRAAGVAFADGHAEMHHWNGPTLKKPRSRGGLLGVIGNAQNMFTTTAGDPDIYWLSYGSPRRTTRTVAGL
jgi:prepilin-type processing-associated H-X9-DG protein